MILRKVVAILMLNLAFAACVISEIEAQAEYSVDISEATWDHSTIRILLIPQEDEPWWDSEFITLTLQAIDTWNKALETFASTYQDFAYLSNIRLAPTESAGATQDFDVYISWIEKFADSSSGAAGFTTLYTLSEVIRSCNMTLAAKDFLSMPLPDVVKQGVALHEIGHALGLLHANYSDDVMFYQAKFDISVRPISSLDAYGVAQVFRWRSLSPQFDPSNQEPRPSSVSLPSGIEYEYLNAPQQDPFSRIISSFLLYIQTPGGLIVFIIVMVVLIVISSALIRFYTERNRKDQNGNSISGDSSASLKVSPSSAARAVSIFYAVSS